MGRIQMSLSVSDAELQNVVALDARGRVRYFVSTAAAKGGVWSVRDVAGCCLAKDPGSGAELMPIWPHERYAAYAAPQWGDVTPEFISLAEWLEKWAPGLQRDNRLLAVFPVPAGGYALMRPKEVSEALEAELDESYGQ
jgi:hypothetical protein